MASRTRGNIPVRRAVPAQPPQPQAIQHPRPHPSSSKVSSFAQNQDSTSSQKQAPTTHLKSTTVSKQESKRPAPRETGNKPSFARRSTLDNPSSPSTTQNTRASPNPTPRTTSTLSSKSATTQKTVPARNPSSQYARPVNSSVKKKFIYVRKQDIVGTSAATTKEQSRSPPEEVEVSDAYEVTQPQQNQQDQEHSITEAKEEAIQVGGSDEAKADVLEQEDPAPIRNEHTKPENDMDVDLKNDKQDTTLAVKIEVTEDTSQVPETVSIINQEFSESNNINEINSSGETHDSAADNPTSEAEETNKEQAETVLVSDIKETVGAESEVPETKETEAQEVGRKTEVVVAKTAQVPKAKKESVVSNDVIEETASKLREQRKNKVKALAGAFETVISLQEQK